MKRVTVAGCLAIGLSVLASSALALTGGQVDPNVPESPWAGVVSITPTTGGTFSGALIDPWHVLTAAHVVYGNRDTPGNIVVNLNAGPSASGSIAAARVFIHDRYTTGNTRSDAVELWNDDIAVIRLAEPVPVDVPTYALFPGTPGVAGATRDIALVGYGGYANGATSTVTQPGSPSVKRFGRNRVDRLWLDDEGSGKVEVFAFDFDGPTADSNVYLDKTDPANLTLGEGVEAGYAGGDSGSPVFVYDRGAWKIAGVAAFNGTPASLPDNTSVQFGAIGGGMVVAPYIPWIEAQIATPVPEADTWALMLSGLGIVGWIARRRRSPPA